MRAEFTNLNSIFKEIFFSLIVINYLIFPNFACAADQDSLIKEADNAYFSSIKGVIRNKLLYLYYHYDIGNEGVVKITFTVFSNGKIDYDSIIVDGDCDTTLKNLIVLGMEKASPLRRFPKELREYEMLRFELEIVFKDNGGTPVLEPWKIGVKLSDINEDVRYIHGISLKRGILLTAVFKDTPADKAGLKPGDIILSVNKIRMNQSQLIKYLRKHKGNLVIETSRGEFMVQRGTLDAFN